MREAEAITGLTLFKPPKPLPYGQLRTKLEPTSRKPGHPDAWGKVKDSTGVKEGKPSYKLAVPGERLLPEAPAAGPDDLPRGEVMVAMGTSAIGEKVPLSVAPWGGGGVTEAIAQVTVLHGDSVDVAEEHGSLWVDRVLIGGNG